METLEDRLERVQQRNHQYADELIEGWRKSYEAKGLVIDGEAVCSIREMDDDYAYIVMHTLNGQEISEVSEIPVHMIRESDTPDAGVGSVFYFFACFDRSTNERSVGINVWHPRTLSEDESTTMKEHASEVYNQISRHS